MAPTLPGDPSAAMLRRVDPDRYFSALFAPATARAFLNGLYLLNAELARVAEQVQQPMLGEIRLQWWRETLEGAREGRPRSTDVARILADAFARYDLPRPLFDAMIDARSNDLSEKPFGTRAELESYLDSTSGNLVRLATRILGGDASVDAAAGEAGLAYGLAGVARAIPYHARQGRILIPDQMLRERGVSETDLRRGMNSVGVAAIVGSLALDARHHLQSLRRRHVPRSLLAAFLPASLVPLYLRRLARVGNDPFRLTEVPIPRRQMSLLRASFSRRV